MPRTRRAFSRKNLGQTSSLKGTLGSSVMKAVRAVRDRNCRVLKVITIVDRLEGAAETFSREGLEFVPIFTTKDFD